MAQKKDLSSKFGERLRTVRRESGLSLESIAEKVNTQFGAHINKGMLSKYENGINEPGAGMIHCIAAVLNVSGDYLTGKSDERTDAAHSPKNGGSAVPVQIFSIITGDSFTP
ncbi:MAG: helix-turn-helix transcriptional regulator, partial [Clostridia bacterium]|nr:helix-turn-helix transcriptional regulator [Clostridia bacterium]